MSIEITDTATPSIIDMTDWAPRSFSCWQRVSIGSIDGVELSICSGDIYRRVSRDAPPHSATMQRVRPTAAVLALAIRRFPGFRDLVPYVPS